MIKLGRYKHYKGDIYEVIAVAKHTETEEDLVVYVGLDKEAKLWARPVDNFLGEVEVKGNKIKRFESIEE